ncbi:MAG TPA: DUF6288 domain-containing protein [Haloferula sp.]
MKLRYSSYLLLAAAPAWAAPLEVEPLQSDAGWRLPGGEQGILLEAGKSAAAAVRIPDFTDKEKDIGGKWRGILSVDAHGTLDGSKGALVLDALDPKSGEVFASAETMVTGRVPRAAWAVIASSEQGGASAEKLFDGDPKTDWHSRYGQDEAKPPHWAGLEFGTPQKLEGVRYSPRQGGFTNGVAKKYRIEIRKPGGAWETISAGETDNSVANDRKPLEVKFPSPVTVDAFRFVIESDWAGGGFGTGGEIEPLGVKRPEKQEVAVLADSRAWLELPDELMKQLIGKNFGLRVTAKNGGAAVIVGAPQLSRIHELPTEKLFGRSNGGTGPDKLGAGLLGFDALTEHGQSVLTVMEVRKSTPASKAKLKAGDAIVAIAGKPLAVNNLEPGWEWFHRSHEALLGRATEATFKAGKKSLSLTVLREGKPVELAFELPRTRAFTSMNPANDAEAAALLKELLAYLEITQKEDGSWSGDMIRTSFSSLALLATGEKKYHGRVKKAVEWAMAKYPKPDDYGNLGFWAGAYAGILYSEWHLRTGDRQVLPNLEALRDWAIKGQHKSSWGVPAFGHGPSGLPYENKALVAPACHLLIFEALAQRCGMKSGIWELLTPYMEMAWSDPKEGGHGALGYNRSYKDTEEFWSRSGQFAMTCHLRRQRPDMRDAMTSFMRGHHPWFRNSHAYGEPGGSWGLLGLNLASPQAYQEVIREYGWWFSLAWEPGYGLRFTTPHMGAPYMGEDDLINATYALVLQGPRRSLHLTGLSSSAHE